MKKKQKSGNFMKQNLNNAIHFYKIAMSQLKHQKKLFGTNVIVKRNTQNSEEPEEFEYVILINVQDIYWGNVNQTNLVDNEDKLKVNDTLIFAIENQKYEFKVTEQKLHGKGEKHICSQYQLTKI